MPETDGDAALLMTRNKGSMKRITMSGCGSPQKRFPSMSGEQYCYFPAEKVFSVS